MAANQTITVLEADGVTSTDVEVLGTARQAAANSKSIALSTEDKAVLDSLATKLDTAITALQIIDNMVLSAGTANIGDVDVLTVPADPFGANADAASITGSISAKLRAISTALGATALDLGSGTGGTRTLRSFLDTAQWVGGNGAITSATQRMALATDSPGVIATAAPGTLSAAGPSVTAVNPSQYETVAASATAQVLGATGGTGDFINGLLVIPATTSPGNVLLLDNATSITVFAGGATSVSNLVPFFIPLGMTSVSGAWKVTTGTNVSVIGIGKFT